jgi:predicted DCC family thiol-disulfide oxidoreductase YuxK
LSAESAPILLYDGSCLLCSRAVRFVLAHDRRGTILFAPLQGITAHEVLARHPHLADVDALVFVTGYATARECVLVRSDAVLAVAHLVGAPRPLTALLHRVPRPWRDAAYDLLARWRYRLFGRDETCPVPAPAHRTRFLP